jgi:hypothetical protein
MVAILWWIYGEYCILNDKIYALFKGLAILG